MTSQTVAWFSHGSPISEQHCLWTLLKQASTKVEIIPQEKWFSEAMFQWPSLDACPEVQHWYVGTVPRRTVQPIAASRLGSNCIQAHLHHTAIEETRSRPGRRAFISTDLQFVGSREAARTTCRSAASGLSQSVEAASRPAICFPSPPFHGDSGC